MTICFKQNPPKFDPISIDKVPLQSVDSAKLVGVTLQSDLKWDENTDNILKKAQKRLYFFKETETSWRRQNRFVTILYKYHKACLRVRGTRMGYKSYTIAKRQIRKHTKKSLLHHLAGCNI